MFRGMSVTPIPNDKDSGYTLVDDSDIKLVLAEITSRNRYRKLNDEQLRLRRFWAKLELAVLAQKDGYTLR